MDPNGVCIREVPIYLHAATQRMKESRRLRRGACLARLYPSNTSHSASSLLDKLLSGTHVFTACMGYVTPVHVCSTSENKKKAKKLPQRCMFGKTMQAMSLLPKKIKSQ